MSHSIHTTPGPAVRPVRATAHQLWLRLLLTALALAPLAFQPRQASAAVVLLDEYWAPEIQQDGVVVREVDALERNDPALARFGECSAEITNKAGGAPNVRFRGAAMVTLAGVAPDVSQVSLWYRTDHWTGRWRLEVFVFHVPKDSPLATYIWLRPESGHGIAHRTYIDRIEIGPAPDQPPGDPPPAPARRVRPRPGFQTTGPDWIWWEAEDALAHNFPAGSVFLPYTVAEQSRLSNGMWLGHPRSEGWTAAWEVEVAQPGKYAFWCRGQGWASFRWRWDEGEWGECVGRDAAWVDPVKFREHPRGPILAWWTRLGEVELSAGKHRLTIEGTPKHSSLGLDCWLLTRGDFTPNGPEKPTT